eukprot:maker-scaffold_3-augustus-gene-14.0-mRNA-1 protein AED:0.16 eAED:0.17 QI:0/0/0/1/1/1/2/0/594
MNLSAHLDPSSIAESALDLNLKLMVWRQFPDLDLTRIKQTRCLLLGAGTLGCAVSRVLLAWGFKHIDFLDNGLVSASNPARQSLYLLSDVNKKKCFTAAETLKEIMPRLESEGYDMTIPMPGHYFEYKGDEALFSSDVYELYKLIKHHEVIFLLTDTRESRWLPTVLGRVLNKTVINCALGFDSFLVMRHGNKDVEAGCYFCNDVVAPQNSTSNRTLDQQCTVTKPGLAPITAGLAVEVLVAQLHGNEVPDQIRGFLSDFKQIEMKNHRFKNCSACSQPVLKLAESSIDAYARIGEHDGVRLPLEFVEIFKNEATLEEISGLAKVKAEAEQQRGDEASGGKILKFCYVLEEYIQKCELDGEYEEAEKAYEQLISIKKQECKRQVEELRLKQTMERQNLVAQQRIQVEKFYNTWRQYLTSFNELAKQYVEQLKAKHSEEKNTIKQKDAANMSRRQTMECRIFKPSKNLLEWRRRQNLLAKCKNYAEAQKVKLIADKIEEQERGRSKNIWKDSASNQERSLILRQKNEMEVLKKKINTRRKEHQAQRDKDAAILSQRNRNLMSSLSQKHKIEVRNHESTIYSQLCLDRKPGRSPKR